MKIFGYATSLGGSIFGSNSDLNSGGTDAARTSPYTKEHMLLNSSTTARSKFYLNEPTYFCWASFYVHTNETYYNGRDFLALNDEDGNRWVRVFAQGYGDGGYLRVVYYDVENNTNVFIPLVVPEADWDIQLLRVDLEYQPHAIRLYINHQLVCEFIGYVPRPTKPIIEAVFDAARSNTAISGAFVADSDTRRVNMVQHEIVGAGTIANDFSGSYDNVNDFGTLGVVDGMTSDVAGDEQTFLASAYPIFASQSDVLAVGVFSRSSGDGQVIKKTSHFISDGVNEVESMDSPIDTVVSPKLSILYTAPDGTDWTKAKFDACEFGVRTKA